MTPAQEKIEQIETVGFGAFIVLGIVAALWVCMYIVHTAYKDYPTFEFLWWTVPLFASALAAAIAVFFAIAAGLGGIAVAVAKRIWLRQNAVR